MSEDFKQFMEALSSCHAVKADILQWHGRVPSEIRELSGTTNQPYFTYMGISIDVQPKYTTLMLENGKVKK